MAWLGLVPSEHSSGSTTRQGQLTKTGNALVYRPSEILLMLQGRKRSDEWAVGRQHQAMDGEAQIRTRH
ncbi:transposase [Ruegeria pomeroyi]|nr:transposase [Ruegeria pomeroyi]